MVWLWALVHLIWTATLTSADAVVRLDNVTFPSYILDHPLVLVKFCVPWYERCEKLSPEFETAAATLLPQHIPLVELDCVESANLCNNYNVSSYPALRIFRGPDSVTRYRETRTAKAITTHMITLTLPPIIPITVSNFASLTSLEKRLLIGFFASNDTNSLSLLTTLHATLSSSFLFGTTSDFSLAQTSVSALHSPQLSRIAPPFDGDPFFVLHSPTDELPSIISVPLGQATSINRASFEDILEKTSTELPMVGKFSIETYYAYTETQFPLALLFAPTEKARKDIAILLAPLALRYKHGKQRLNFATIDSTQYAFFAGPLGLNADLITEDNPAFVIEDVVSGETYPFSQRHPVTVEAIGSFAKVVLEKLGNEEVRHEEL